MKFTEVTVSFPHCYLFECKSVALLTIIYSVKKKNTALTHCWGKSAAVNTYSEHINVAIRTAH